MSVYDGGSFGGVPYDEGDTDFSNQANNQANNSGVNASYSASLADPFASQRAGYQTQLKTLTSNPGDFSTSPYYQFAYDQGLNAVNRTAAAAGNLNSGNRLAALTKYGQGMAGQGYFQQAGLLSTLAGANAGSPGAASQAYQGGVNRQQDQQSAALAAQKFGENPNPSGTGTGLPTGNGVNALAMTPSASGATNPYAYTPDGGLNALSGYTPAPSTPSAGGYDFSGGYDPYAGGGNDYGNYDFGQGQSTPSYGMGGSGSVGFAGYADDPYTDLSSSYGASGGW